MHQIIKLSLKNDLIELTIYRVWLDSGAGYGCCPRQEAVTVTCCKPVLQLVRRDQPFFFSFTKVACVAC